VSLSFDRIADRYDQTRGYPETIMEDLLRALEGALDKDKTILDAGVGTGRFAKPLQDRGYDIVGIDLSPRMLRKAANKGTVNLVRGDITKMPFQDRVFWATMSIHVLHLVPSWRMALTEICRVTTDRFVSIAFRKDDSPAEEIREFYDKMCAELGCRVRHPGLRERELPDLLPPDVDRVIVTHEHPIRVEDMIKDFETRTYSSQWLVPEEVHQQAISALREAFGEDDSVVGRERISLLEWDIYRIWKFSIGPELKNF
jgi:ubiquinone/menaquinone biosynthesis C-methylase UbiE